MTCSHCAKCEAHGYPRHEVPEWYAFTVHLWCPVKGKSVNFNDTCDKHEPGEPRKVRDDADW